MELVVADIFCGAGGLSAGFRAAQAHWPTGQGQHFEIAYGIDKDNDAIETFRTHHFPGRPPERLEVVAPCKALDKVTTALVDEILRAADPWGRVDVLVGGPSCQGVSAAGLRNPGDERNDGLTIFIDLVAQLRPKWFVMESVPGLTHVNNRELLAAIFEKLEAIEGYHVAGDMLLAANYGVPQFRHRLFIIGTNTGSPIRFPNPTHIPPSFDGTQLLPGFDNTYRTVRDAIGDLATSPPAVYCEDVAPDEPVGTDRRMPPNHFCVDFGEGNRERIATVGQGRDWRDMPIRLLPERYYATRASDQKGAYGRLLWDWPSYTITNSTYNVTSGPYTHPDQDRSLSVREAARLQSFEDNHVFLGDVLSQYRQVGNAVPPKLAQAVAEAILFCHCQGEKAREWGRPGRLTTQIVRDAANGNGTLPTMTPRFAHPSFDRRRRPMAPVERASGTRGDRVSAWMTDPRPTDPFPEHTRRLRRLANQPSNYRAAKRARAIVQFIDGVSTAEIVAQANVSATSVQKWVDGYFALGLDGWRAYHTSNDKIAGNDVSLRRAIERATTKARKIYMAQRRRGAEPAPKRLHMNNYLLQLRDRFGALSVAELISQVEAALDRGLGTVYVGDLLAIADVVLLPQTDNIVATPKRIAG